MKFTHATLLLNETGAEINETNLTAVLEAAGDDVDISRVKAVVASLEGVDLTEYAATDSTDDGAAAPMDEPSVEAGAGPDASAPSAANNSCDIDVEPSMSDDVEEEG